MYKAGDNLLDIKVKQQIRIGDLLRLRGHTEQAIMEYQKALVLNGVPVPDITDRLGGAFTDSGRYSEAVEILSPMQQLYPFHFTTFVLLGRANLKMGANEEAIKAFNHAIAIDPFYPDVHCLLSKAYKGIDKIQLYKTEKDQCLLLAPE
jgi:tetratricopeptide (TPR) repeat protein